MGMQNLDSPVQIRLGPPYKINDLQKSRFYIIMIAERSNFMGFLNFLYSTYGTYGNMETMEIMEDSTIHQQQILTGQQLQDL